jgi:hypothetical protein
MKSKKIVVITLSLMLFATLALSVPAIFAGTNNANDDNGYQGTNKDSNTLPDQANVPWPAGFLEDLFGAPHVVDGCRAGGGDIPIYEAGLGGTVDGGPCCKGPMIEEGPGAGAYEPNQCCNPPDIIYPEIYYTPGNHCLCFVMRWEGPLPV